MASKLFLKIVKLVKDTKVLLDNYEKTKQIDEEAFKQVEKNVEDIFIEIYGKTVGMKKFKAIRTIYCYDNWAVGLINIVLTCIEASKEAKFAEQEAKEIKERCEASIKRIRAFRIEYERTFNQRFTEQHARVDASFNVIDEGLRAYNYKLLVEALKDFANTLSIKLNMSDFTEFDHFMRTSESLQI